jgi:serine-type D-Ala-D-Ala carboxypeptidase/endopeptidase (penicillin-binding protein 4)
MKGFCPKLFLLLLLPLLLCFAPGNKQLQTETDKLNTDPDLSSGSWSLYVITADSGTVLANVNAARSHTPASTLKIFTTAAALHLLGTEYRYETVLEYSGSFDSLSGKISGNLYIRGSGDPTLDSRYFSNAGDSTQLERWAAALYKKGVRSIEGAAVADASAFGGTPVPDGWTWGDLGQYYGAQSSALTWHDNSYSLFYNTTADTAKLMRTMPVPEAATLVSQVSTGGSRDEAFVYGAPYGNVHYIRGRIPAAAQNYEVEAALPDPALQCAAEFTRTLEKQGINVKAAPSTIRLQEMAGVKNNSTRKKILATQSPKLSEIIYWTNLKSDNVYAEQLLRTIGLVKGNGGTVEDGTAAVVNFWKQQGINTKGMFINDGSGLSRSNAVTTQQQAEALRIITQWPKKEYEAFKRSLPVAGKSGSLASLCKGSFAENNLMAKSGYITRARGYTGYVKTRSGKLVCFSLLANNYTCTATEMKKKLERILIAIAEL